MAFRRLSVLAVTRYNVLLPEYYGSQGITSVTFTSYAPAKVTAPT